MCNNIKIKINFLLSVVTKHLIGKCLKFLHYIYLKYLNETRFCLKRLVFSAQGTSPVTRVVMIRNEHPPVNRLLPVISVLRKYINEKGLNIVNIRFCGWGNLLELMSYIFSKSLTRENICRIKLIYIIFETLRIFRTRVLIIS